MAGECGPHSGSQPGLWAAIPWGAFQNADAWLLPLPGDSGAIGPGCTRGLEVRWRGAFL